MYYNDLSKKSNTNHVHDDRYYTENEINVNLATVTSGSGSLVSNPYIDAVNLSWYKCGKLVIISGSISCKNITASGGAFFFAQDFPYSSKQLLGIAISYTGDPSGEHARGNFYCYAEEGKLSCYPGTAIQTQSAAYIIHGCYFL